MGYTEESVLVFGEEDSGVLRAVFCQAVFESSGNSPQSIVLLFFGMVLYQQDNCLRLILRMDF